MKETNDMKDMKKVGSFVSFSVCLTFSIILPLIGVIQSGSFKVGVYLLNMIISFVMSYSISLLVPLLKINMMIEKKLHLKFASLKARLLETLVSDLIYTPVITTIMTAFAWYNIKTSGEEAPPFVPMLLSSVTISFAVAYIVMFFIVPIYVMLGMKINGISALGPSPDNKKEMHSKNDDKSKHV